MPEDAKMSQEDAIDAIWKLVKSIDFCMFVTWDGERQRARPLSARPDRDAGKIFFLTDVAGEKDNQIDRFPVITMAFADIRSHDYVAITGTAVVSNDRARIKELWTGPDRAFWDGPDDPAVRVIEVTPDDAELWQGPNRIVAGAKMIAAAVLDTSPDFGDNVKVDHI